MPSPVSLATVFDMATAVPFAKFITMNEVVAKHYSRLLNTGLYFHQPDGKISVCLIQEVYQVWKALKHVGESIILHIQLPLLIILLARIFDES